MAIDLTRVDGGREAFLAEVEHHGGRNIRDCYACGKCSAGCPLAFAMEKQPHQVLRMVQLGLVDEALKSQTIWLCACCLTCTTRCPRLVDVAGTMEALRILARRRGIAVPESAVAKFHDIFLDTVRSGGKLHEMSLVLKYKLSTGQLFGDIDLAPGMMAKGKLKLRPDKVKGIDEVRRIFEKVKESEGSGR